MVRDMSAMVMNNPPVQLQNEMYFQNQPCILKKILKDMPKKIETNRNSTVWWRRHRTSPNERFSLTQLGRTSLLHRDPLSFG